MSAIIDCSGRGGVSIEIFDIPDLCFLASNKYLTRQQAEVIQIITAAEPPSSVKTCNYTNNGPQLLKFPTLRNFPLCLRYTSATAHKLHMFIAI